MSLRLEREVHDLREEVKALKAVIEVLVNRVAALESAQSNASQTGKNAKKA